MTLFDDANTIDLFCVPRRPRGLSGEAYAKTEGGNPELFTKEAHKFQAGGNEISGISLRLKT
jgi:CRISPR/Cas system-associated protein Cas7 (RAMP superfamily)